MGSTFGSLLLNAASSLSLITGLVILGMWFASDFSADDYYRYWELL